MVSIQCGIEARTRAEDSKFSKDAKQGSTGPYSKSLPSKIHQTIYDVHKEAKAQRGLRHIRYANVNKRVRALEESGYIKKIGIKKTKAGLEASIYELAIKAYLALSSTLSTSMSY